MKNVKSNFFISRDTHFRQPFLAKFLSLTFWLEEERHFKLSFRPLGSQLDLLFQLNPGETIFFFVLFLFLQQSLYPCASVAFTSLSATFYSPSFFFFLSFSFPSLLRCPKHAITVSLQLDSLKPVVRIFYIFSSEACVIVAAAQTSSVFPYHIIIPFGRRWLCGRNLHTHTYSQAQVKFHQMS